MATFCGNCGAPVSGGFCGKCGARVAQQPPPASPVYQAMPAAPVQSGGASGLKIVLIILGVLFFFALLGIGGLYLTARSVLRTAGVVAPSSPGVFSSLRNTVNARRDGCALLPPDEVASILGIEVGKTNGAATPGQSGEHCDYYLKPGASDAYAEKFKESLEAAKAKGNQPQTNAGSIPQMNEQARNAGVENVLKNMMRAGGAVANDGSEPFFSFTVDREGGANTFHTLLRANSAGRILTNGKEMIEQLPGVGDGAFLTPLDTGLVVLKHDTCVTFNLLQVPDAKVKGAELAKRVVSRL